MSSGAELLPLDGLGEGELAAWRRLSDQALEPNPFFDPDLVLAAAGALDTRVSLLVLRGEEGWRACLPVTTERGWRGVPISALVAWRHRYCYLGTPLVAPGDPEAALADLLELGLAQTNSFLGLDLLATGGPVWQPLGAAMSKTGVKPVELRRFERASLDAGQEPPTNLSSKHRRNMRRLADRLGEQLGAPLELDDRAGDEDAYDRFLALEDAGWKGEQDTAMASAGHSEFFREICRSFAARDSLQLLDLNSGGTTVAMICVLIAGDTGFTFKIAIDEEHRKSGPGTQLMLAQIEPLNEPGGLQHLDTCAEPGHEMAERAWAGRRELAILALPRPGARGIAARGALRGAMTARGLLRR